MPSPIITNSKDGKTAITKPTPTDASLEMTAKYISLMAHMAW